MNLCFSISKRNLGGSALFQRAATAGFQKNRGKIFHKVMGAGLLVFTNQVQLAVIRNACEFALEADTTLSYAEEKQLQSVQEQIELLLPQQEQEQEQHSEMEQTM